MRSPRTVRSTEQLGRVGSPGRSSCGILCTARLRPSRACPNLPDDPDLAIAAGQRPLRGSARAAAGRFRSAIAIRSGLPLARGSNGLWQRPLWQAQLRLERSATMAQAHLGPTKSQTGTAWAPWRSVVIALAGRSHAGAGTQRGRRWRGAIHDHLPYSDLPRCFPKLVRVQYRLARGSRSARSSASSARADI